MSCFCVLARVYVPQRCCTDSSGNKLDWKKASRSVKLDKALTVALQIKACQNICDQDPLCMTAWYNHQAGININISWSWDFIKNNPEYCIVFDRNDKSTQGITEEKHETKEFASAVRDVAKKEFKHLAAKQAEKLATSVWQKLYSGFGSATGAKVGAKAGKAGAKKAATKAAAKVASNAATKAAAKLAAKMVAKKVAGLVVGAVSMACPHIFIAVSIYFAVDTAMDVVDIANKFSPDCTPYGRDTCITKAFSRTYACATIACTPACALWYLSGARQQQWSAHRQHRHP